MKRLALLFTPLIVMAATATATFASPPQQTTVATATVTADTLNVRTAPDLNASVLARVSQGYAAGVIGRTADSSWYQIILPGGSGWASAAYLNVINAHTVPVTYNSGPSAVTAGGYVNTGALNLRSVPGATNNIPLAELSRNTRVTIIGRSVDSQWYYVQTGNLAGWVRGRYIAVDVGNINNVSILGTGPVSPTPLPPTSGTVYATGTVNTGALNIRSVPSAYFNTPLTHVYRSTALNIIGRTADNNWYLVNVPSAGNINGWVRSRHVSVTGGNVSLAPIVG